MLTSIIFSRDEAGRGLRKELKQFLAYGWRMFIRIRIKKCNFKSPASNHYLTSGKKVRLKSCNYGIQKKLCN